MSTKTTLKAAHRATKGKEAASAARYAGRVPAVLYGRAQAPAKITVDAKETLRLLAHEGSHAMIELEVEGGDAAGTHTVMLREVQRDPLKDRIRHVDFQAVGMDDVITRIVPLRLVGTPIGLKVGGVLQYGVRSVSVKGLTRDIPDSIQVDLSPLHPGQILKVGQIPMPAGVTPSGRGIEIVASVLIPRGKGAEASAALADMEAEASAGTASSDASSDSTEDTASE